MEPNMDDDDVYFRTYGIPEIDLDAESNTDTATCPASPPPTRDMYLTSTVHESIVQLREACAQYVRAKCASERELLLTRRAELLRSRLELRSFMKTVQNLLRADSCEWSEEEIIHLASALDLDAL